jgi:ubiquitin carboxyl-terminal hydrolase L3
MAPTYRKHFLPLESNPAVFTQLLHALGGSKNLAFHDIYSLDLLSHIPRPVYALILVFPTSPAYEEQKAVFEAEREEYNGAGEDEDVMWFRQTINNACGLYAILHAICNGEGLGFIGEHSKRG